MAESPVDYIECLWISRENDSFFVMANIHKKGCNPPKKCCRWEFKKISRPMNRDEAISLARSKSRTMGVRFKF